MRVTGSFHTIVTHGCAVSVISSGVRSGSTSTGLVVAIRPSWHSRPPLPSPETPARASAVLALRWPGEHVDGTADRPLRADDAAGGAAVGHRPPALGLRALPSATPGGPSVRRGGRRRPGARRTGGLP